MHETGLNVGADQHAEPDEINSEFVGGRRQHRNDDERDLEEIEEERDHEDEDVDEDQEAKLPTRQRGQHVLDPDFAADALKYQAENARADQDEHHHSGKAHGGGH